MQLHNLTWFLLHDKIIPDVYGMSHSTNITVPHLKDVVPTWQQSCAFSILIIKFKALQTQKPLYTQLICTLYSACLPLHTVQLCSLTRRTFAACWMLHACTCTHLAITQYCTTLSPNVSRSSTWHTHTFPLQKTANDPYECCSTSDFHF